MIGWLGFVGKLLEFSATKIIGRQFDLTLDRKKRACRDLLEMYELLVELEAFASRCIAVFEPVATGKKPRLYSPVLRQLDARARELSERFLQTLKPLARALTILDPDLGEAFENLRLVKAHGGSSFWFSDVFRDGFQTHRLVRNEEIGTCLELYVPRADPTSTLEENYGGGSERLRFPEEDVLRRIVDADGIARSIVEPEDVAAIRELCENIRVHMRRLAKTRVSLGAFISARFSIEDLLYVRGK